MTHFNIIGGGIVGASIGYHLVKHGADVTVFDRGDHGQATNASAGIICPWVSQRRNKKWYRMVTEGAKYYPKFIGQLEKETQLDTGYICQGSISLFKNEDKLKLGYNRIKSKQEEAPEMGEVKVISCEEINQLHPHLNNEYPGVFVEGGGQVRGKILLHALKKAFLSLGGEWINENAPEQIEGYNIYTTGAWGRYQNFEPTVRHQRSEVLHFKIEDREPVSAPVIMALGPIYIVEMGVNQYAIGTTHIDTNSFDAIPSHENYQYLRELAERYFPNSKITDIEMLVGLKPYTRDHLPFIGAIDESTYVVNGLGATGLTASPVVGREVANYLMGQQTSLNLEEYGYI